MSVREGRAVVATGLIAGLALTASVSSCGAPQNDAKQTVLQIGAIPDQNPEKLNRLYGTLSTELSEKLDVPVRYAPVSNYAAAVLSLIHISEPTRQAEISYAVFCLKKKR